MTSIEGGGAGAGAVALPHTFSCTPMTMSCPSCKKSVQTTITPVTGCMTWTVFGLLLFTTGCCCLAFYSDCTKDMEHHCPNCGFFFGSYKRFGG